MSKIILHHRGGFGGVSFDFFATQEDLKAAREELDGHCYQVRCHWAQDFMRECPEYFYLGSEDLEHTSEANAAVEQLIARLRTLGWEERYAQISTKGEKE